MWHCSTENIGGRLRYYDVYFGTNSFYFNDDVYGEQRVVAIIERVLGLEYDVRIFRQKW